MIASGAEITRNNGDAISILYCVTIALSIQVELLITKNTKGRFLSIFG